MLKRPAVVKKKKKKKKIDQDNIATSDQKNDLFDAMTMSHVSSPNSLDSLIVPPLHRFRDLPQAPVMPFLYPWPSPRHIPTSRFAKTFPAAQEALCWLRWFFSRCACRSLSDTSKSAQVPSPSLLKANHLLICPVTSTRARHIRRHVDPSRHVLFAPETVVAPVRAPALADGDGDFYQVLVYLPALVVLCRFRNVAAHLAGKAGGAGVGGRRMRT